MKLSNQNNAVLIFLLHSFLIPIGMIGAYLIPSTEDPTSYVLIPLTNLKSQDHSNAELQSWLNFLELLHEETLIDKDTICETLEENEALRKLDFFSNVAESDHVDHLADRISASAEPTPYFWKLTLRDASHEEANTLFRALYSVVKRKFLDQVAAYDPPIEILPLQTSVSPASASVDSTPSDRFHPPIQFGKACTPAVGALLAATLVVVAWSLCMPSQRRLPFTSSISLLLACTFMLSFVGAGIGYLIKVNSDTEWESEITVQINHIASPAVGNLTSETQSLIAKLNQKLEVDNHFGYVKYRSYIQSLVDEKKMMTWCSFEPIAKAKGFETEEGGAEDADLLCNYIMDRLEVEQAPEAGNIYTLRFRCEDTADARGVLCCIVDDYSAILEERNDSVALGGLLVSNYEINRSNIETKKVLWPRIASGHTFQGAFIGAIFTLVIVSSTRVLAGATPI